MPDQIRTFTINGTVSSTWGMLSGIERAITPEVSINMQSVPLRAGAYVPAKNARSVGVRNISVRFFIRSVTITQLRAAARTIAGFMKNLNDDNLPKQLTFSDEPSRAYDVYFTGEIGWEEINSTCAIAQVDFLAAQPFAYDPSTKQVNFSGTSAVITYAGTERGYPIIKYAFSASAGSIQFNQGTKLIKITRSFAAGETVIVDNSRNIAYLEGSGLSLMPYLDISSRFFDLKAQTTTTITASSSAYSTAFVQYVERYV